MMNSLISATKHAAHTNTQTTQRTAPACDRQCADTTSCSSTTRTQSAPLDRRVGTLRECSFAEWPYRAASTAQRRRGPLAHRGSQAVETNRQTNKRKHKQTTCKAWCGYKRTRGTHRDAAIVRLQNQLGHLARVHRPELYHILQHRRQHRERVANGQRLAALRLLVFVLLDDGAQGNSAPYTALASEPAQQRNDLGTMEGQRSGWSSSAMRQMTCASCGLHVCVREYQKTTETRGKRTENA